MVFTKQASHASAVTVETKKLSGSDTCCTGKGYKTMKHLLIMVLVIFNTVLLVWVLLNQKKIESERVGGRANYKMVKQIYKSDAFKAQQKQQIEQALQMYQGGGQAAGQAAGQQQFPTTTQTDPTTAPAVAQ